jgi:hypothetical protein
MRRRPIQHQPIQHWDDSAAAIVQVDRTMPDQSNTILIVGAPRSGTTWLAKIFDSHPDTLYRHEPDEIVQPDGAIGDCIALWAAQRDARTAGKRPFFAKSWQSAPQRSLRTVLAYGGAAASRLGFAPFTIPDLGDTNRARLVIKSVRLAARTSEFARAFPHGRALLILRHPCGQVASVMRGTRDGRFDLAEAGTDMPFDEAAAVAYAARAGLDHPAFQALPDAAKYAWSWRACNEPAVAAIAGLSNARLVIYEDLCARPEAGARAMLEFCGLEWLPSVAEFVRRGSQAGDDGGYYAVVRNSIAAAQRWRTAMTPSDQAAVRDVVGQSELARYWNDLAAA